MNAVLIPAPTTATPTAGTGAKATTAHDGGASFGATLAEQLGATPAGRSGPAASGQSGATDQSSAQPGTTEAPVTAHPLPAAEAAPVAPTLVVPGQVPLPGNATPPEKSAVVSDPTNSDTVDSAGGVDTTAPADGPAIVPADPATADAAGQAADASAEPGAVVASTPVPTSSGAPTLADPAAQPGQPQPTATISPVPGSSAATTDTPELPTSTPSPTAMVLPAGNPSVPAFPTTVQATPAAAPAAAPQLPEPLNRQLAGPIATLATGPHGERTMTVNVAPDGLGPVTVKAHLGVEGVRVELMAPTDAGRDALRTLLGDLRRDLAVLGHGAVSLATPDRPDSGPGSGSGQQPGTPGNGQQQGAAGQQTGSRAAQSQPTEAGMGETPPDVVTVLDQPTDMTGTTAHPSRLDVLA